MDERLLFESLPEGEGLLDVRTVFIRLWLRLQAGSLRDYTQR